MRESAGSSPSTNEHRAAAGQLPAARVFVLTISDTRTLETDGSGALIADLLAREGHSLVAREVVKDDPPTIRDRVRELCDSGAVDAVLANGGTGISPRDGTIEAVSGLLSKELPGFGELFRMLSWEEIGAAAMLSRAVAGTRGNTLIFTMPGSRHAVELAMTRLILPELRHLVYEMKKGGPAVPP